MYDTTACCKVGGIHSRTWVVLAEGSGAGNSGYSIMDVGPDGTGTVTGFRKQKKDTSMPTPRSLRG